MSTKAIEILSDAIKEYYGNYELEELCNQFNVDVDYLGVNLNHGKLADKLVKKNDYSHQKLLSKLLEDLVARCNHRILNTTWESNVFDEQMQPQLKKLQLLLAKEEGPVKVAEPKNYQFKAQSETIKFFSIAKTAITLVDTQFGSSREPRALVDGFDEILRGYCATCPDVEIRRHVMIHDRYIFFNGRCWLASSSLNLIDSKPLNVIECVDAKSAIAREIERKWREAEKYLV